MNDRFKFRVWSKECSEYVEQECCDCYIRYNGELECYNLKDTDEDCIYDGYPEDDAIVEQCTGLKDKNGKLIYEGDILSVQALDWHKKERWDCEKVKTYWSVEYKNYWNHCGFMVFGINRRFHKPLSRTVIFNSEAEVIGNIHENPELLKESK